METVSLSRGTEPCMFLLTKMFRWEPGLRECSFAETLSYHQLEKGNPYTNSEQKGSYVWHVALGWCSGTVKHGEDHKPPPRPDTVPSSSWRWWHYQSPGSCGRGSSWGWGTEQCLEDGRSSKQPHIENGKRENVFREWRTCCQKQCLGDGRSKWTRLETETKKKCNPSHIIIEVSFAIQQNEEIFLRC